MEYNRSEVKSPCTQLLEFIEKSIEVSITGKINQGYSEDGASTILSIEIKNKCSADLILKNLSNFTFEKNADIFTVKGQESITLRTKVGDKKMTELLKFKVLNGLIEPKKYLEVEFPTGI